MIRSEKTDDAKCCGGPLIHCSWGELGRATVGNDVAGSTKSNIGVPHSPFYCHKTSDNLDLYQTEMSIYVSTQDKSKNIQSPQTGNSPDVHYHKIDKWRYIHRMDFYSAKRMNVLFLQAST